MLGNVFMAVFAVLAVGFAGASAFLYVRAGQLLKQLRAAEEQVQVLRGNSSALVKQLEQAASEDKTKADWLDNMEQEIAHLRRELEKRPKLTRKTYKILTLGIKWTGKTSLTLKWANPLVNLEMIQGTKIERYERTVSHVVQRDITTEHVFEVGDWGGEHIVDALQELIMDEIHGLLIVVDLGGKDAKQVEMQRVQEQLKEFQAQALKFFFAPKTVASCKAVVLFINKSDLIPGTPREVEEKARGYYAPLIDDLMKYSEKVDIRVLVGSANYGHSTHLLFSHYVEKILPKNAYDTQLLQRMKSDASATTRAQGFQLQG
jgi:GTPase SAR1 family protein